MRRFGPALVILLAAALVAAAVVYAGSGGGVTASVVPLKDAKLNIEHNATDRDTGFQGFIDSDGWRRLDVRGPNGTVLTFAGRGSLGKLGLTELFFETVEPENKETSIKA